MWIPSGKRLQFAMENGVILWIFPFNMVIFHRFLVCLPEGNSLRTGKPPSEKVR